MSLPERFWGYLVYDIEKGKPAYALSKVHGHAEAHVDKCRDILAHLCQGDVKKCRSIDPDLASARGFNLRCAQVRMQYKANHDATTAIFEQILGECCGKCWCVKADSTPMKKRKPSYDMVPKAPKKLKKKPVKAKKKLEMVPVEEEEKKKSVEIPDADDMWMPKHSAPNWEFETKKLVDMIKAKKELNKNSIPEDRENFVFWQPEPHWYQMDPEGLVRFFHGFVLKHYEFIAKEGKMNWEHRALKIVHHRQLI